LNFAGWTHFGFSLVVGAGSATLATALSLRLSSSEEEDQRAVLSSGWLHLAVFSGGGLLGLVAVDSADPTRGASGAASYLGLAVAALALVAALAAPSPARGERLRSMIPVAIGVAGLVTFAALEIKGLNPPMTVVAALTAVVVGASVAAPGLVRQPVAGFASLLIVASAGLGMLAISSILVVDQALAAVASLLAGAFLMTSIGRVASREARSDPARGLGVAFILGLVLLTAWLGAAARTGSEANYALGFATFFLDGLVIGLIQERFGEVIGVDTRWGRGKRLTPEDQQVGLSGTLQALAVGVASFLALALLYVAAAGVIGVNEGTSQGRLYVVPLLIAWGVAALLVLAGWRYSVKDQPNYQPPRLAVSGPGAALACAGLIVWSAACLSQVELTRYPCFVLLGALSVGVLTLEDVSRSPARLQLQEPGYWGRAIAVTAALATTATLLLLLGTGLWTDGVPVAPGDAALAALPLLIGSAVLVTAAVAPLESGRRIPRLTPEPALQNVGMVQFLYAALALLGLVIPLYVVGLVELQDPANVGLVAVSALAPLPALLGALFWVLHTNSEHLRQQDPTKPPAELGELVSEGAGPVNENEDVLELNRYRLAWLATHVNLQNRSAIALVTAGGLWMFLTIAL